MSMIETFGGYTLEALRKAEFFHNAPAIIQDLVSALAHEREKVTVLQGRCAALTQERDEAALLAARYREALEKISREGEEDPFATYSLCRCPGDTDDARDYAKFELGEIARAALAATPAEALESVGAERAARELRALIDLAKRYGHTIKLSADPADWSTRDALVLVVEQIEKRAAELDREATCAK